jgi:hypothetical protein
MFSVLLTGSMGCTLAFCAPNALKAAYSGSISFVASLDLGQAGGR